MAFAQTDDVASRLGRPISDANEVLQVETWIEDVEDEIKAAFVRMGLDLEDEISNGAPSMDTLIRIEAKAVVRKLRNPSGLTSVTRSVDDASITERREGPQPSEDSDLLDSEWEALLPTSRSGAFSTRPGFEPDYTGWPSQWV